MVEIHPHCRQRRRGVRVLGHVFNTDNRVVERRFFSASTNGAHEAESYPIAGGEHGAEEVEVDRKARSMARVRSPDGAKSSHPGGQARFSHRVFVTALSFDRLVAAFRSRHVQDPIVPKFDEVTSAEHSGLIGVNGSGRLQQRAARRAVGLFSRRMPVTMTEIEGGDR